VQFQALCSHLHYLFYLIETVYEGNVCHLGFALPEVIFVMEIVGMGTAKSAEELPALLKISNISFWGVNGNVVVSAESERRHM